MKAKSILQPNVSVVLFHSSRTKSCFIRGLWISKHLQDGGVGGASGEKQGEHEGAGFHAEHGKR